MLLNYFFLKRNSLSISGYNYRKTKYKGILHTNKAVQFNKPNNYKVLGPNSFILI
jgi:hypothetical protein